MKVITEERLQEILEATSRVTSKYLLRVLIYECEENDILTVSKLRPMCDAPLNDETILCVGEKYDTFLKVYYDGVHYKDDHNDLYDKEYFIGWIPYPVYKP